MSIDDDSRISPPLQTDLIPGGQIPVAPYDSSSSSTPDSTSLRLEAYQFESLTNPLLYHPLDDFL